jgi:O-antigen ligase
MSSSAAVRTDQPSSGRAPVIVTLCFLSPLLTAIAPRLAPFFLLAIGIVLIVAARLRGYDWRGLLELNPALLALCVVALYTCLSSLWAANPPGAATAAAVLLAATLLVYAATAALATLDKHQARRAATAFVAGALCAAVFVLIELLTDGAITRWAMNSIAALHPERAKHMVIVKGIVKRMNLSELNQNVAMLSLQLWPGLLALRTLETYARRKLIAVLYFLAVAIPVGISEHESSQVALVAALLVFLLARKWPRQAAVGLAAAWCLAFVLVLPMDFLAYRAGLHEATWLPSSFRARVIIWEYTAERVIEHPWFGIGADSTGTLKAEQTTPPEKPKGFVFRRTTGQHAHNLFLQIWYELGLAGVILVALAGVALVLRLPLLPAEIQPFAAAGFTTFAAMAAFAWGVWQIWLMCAVALVPIYFGIAAAPLRSKAREDRAASAVGPASR